MLRYFSAGDLLFSRRRQGCWFGFLTCGLFKFFGMQCQCLDKIQTELALQTKQKKRLEKAFQKKGEAYAHINERAHMYDLM